MNDPIRERLRSIKTFPSLIKYLRDELDWPVESEDFDELTFDYEPEELGLDAKASVKIQTIKQFRPLITKQPWGIFFVKFEPKRLPVVVLRRILRSLVIKKRKSAFSSGQASWHLHDLLFISAYGEDEDRQITLAHFAENPEIGDLPSLRVLGWDGADTARHLDHVYKELHEKLCWPDDETDVDTWRETWSSAFTLRHREVITTSKKLAERLAELARAIRKKVNSVISVESKEGPLRKLMEAFKDALIHDLEEDDFADMYAQTIAYGLLSARISRPAGLVADNIADMVPMTNPFLKELLETFLSEGGRKSHIDFDELGINDVVELLRHANMEAVLRDFNNLNPEEDPVIHFYELFLNEYDHAKKIKCGVFYTPKPIVSFIVRSVDEILRTKFGLEDGLADTTTWGEINKRNPCFELPKNVSPEEPFVQILDPATGTGTFLVEVIECIYTTMKKKWLKEGYMELELSRLWNEYVPTNLLPRLNGFELMMAPYAIAHMKLGLKLYETGYNFSSNERARIYLTNTLEEAKDLSEQFEFMSTALAHEARSVNEIKRKNSFTILIGNPPYTIHSTSTGEWILNLIKDYKPQDEKKLNLDDDYIKFIRYVQFQLGKSTHGIIGFITNNSFLNGLTHRKMRGTLLKDFDTIKILNLHGNLRISETTPDGNIDKNVFEIKQGVSISIFIKYNNNPNKTFYIDLFGERKHKYYYLEENDTDKLEKKNKWHLLDIDNFNKEFRKTRWGKERFIDDLNFFVPMEKTKLIKHYGNFWGLNKIFKIFGSGVKTDRDELLMDFDKINLIKKLKLAFSENYSESFKKMYKIKNSSSYKFEVILKKQKFERENIFEINYRPFDAREIYYKVGFTSRPNYKVMKHFLNKNIGISFIRNDYGASSYNYLLININLVDIHYLGGQTYIAPLYIYENISSSPQSNIFNKSNLYRITNITNEFNNYINLFSNLNNLSPEQILSYIYGLLHSSIYREKYLEFLKIDFPRIPLSDNQNLISKISIFGQELIDIHLLKSPILNEFISNYHSHNKNNLEKVKYDSNTERVYINKNEYFNGIPNNVWDFTIGGYQVCYKWLDDRRKAGRSLSNEDITHYNKIVVALNETIRIMQEIDEVIEEHGGWPGAFVTNEEPEA